MAYNMGEALITTRVGSLNLAYHANVQLLGGAPVFRLYLAGDSNMAGSGISYTAGCRGALYTALRQSRNDVDFIGVRITQPNKKTVPGMWRHCGHAGDKIETITSDFPINVVLTGIPNIIVVMIGTNNISNNESLSTIQTKFNAMIAAFALSAPDAQVIVLSVLPFVLGSGVSAPNLAIWNPVIIAYNAWLASHVPSLGLLYSYLDFTAELSSSDYQADGVHLRDSGYSSMGLAIAKKLSMILPPPTITCGGLTIPRSFTQRTPTAKLSLPGAMTDTATITNEPGLNPGIIDGSVGSSGFSIAIDWYPTSVPIDGVTVDNIVIYGSHGVGQVFWQITRIDAKFLVYWNGLSPILVMSNSVYPSCVKANTWHRIKFSVAPDPAVPGTCLASLYCNAQLVAFVAGVTAATFAAQPLSLGFKNSSFHGTPASYARLQAWNSVNVPTP